MSVQNWPSAKSFRVALYTIINTLLIPILLIVAVPVLIFRQLNKLCIKNFHKDSHHIGETLNPTAQSIVNDCLAPKPKYNIVLCWIGEGSLSIESLRKIFTNNILFSKVDDGKGSSKLEYPELTSQIRNYAGYFYYKQIPDFDIKNYVRPYHHETTEQTITSERDLKRIVAQLTAKGWSKDRSKWEVLLINNYVDRGTTTAIEEAKQSNFKSKTVIIFRFHHFLMDGYSIQRILKLLSTGNFKKSADFKKNSMTLKRILFAPFLFPYNMAVLIEELTSQPSSPWRMSKEKQKKARLTLYQEWSGAVPLEAIKRIKNTYGISFQAVLNCVVGGAIQKLMVGMNEEVPEVIPVFLPRPLPGHPGGCVNHFGAILPHLPVGEIDPVKRLKLSEVEMQRLSKTPLPFMSYLLYNFLGMFPSPVIQLMAKMDVGHSLLFSPFPVLEGVNYIGNCRAIDTIFTVGLGYGSGTTITACSSYEKIRFAITIDQQVYSSEEHLTRFDEFIQADIKALLKNIL